MVMSIQFKIILFLSLLFFGCGKPEKRILVIHSYEENFFQYSEYNELITKNFKQKGIKTDIKTFYLDCEKYREQEEIDRINLFLNSISNWHPDIILVNEDQATYSLLKTEHKLAKSTPIVFAGVNYPNWDLIQKYPNVTGLHDKIDIIKNLEVMEELDDKKKSFTILDYTFIDKKIREDIKKHLNTGSPIISNIDEQIPQTDYETKFKDKLFLHILSARNNHLYDKDSVQIPQLSLKFLWGISKYNVQMPYLQLKYDFTTVTLANFHMTNRYSAIYEMFGCGFDFRAGYMTTLPTQVKEEVDLAAKILNGIKPQDLPIRESAKDYVVDWQVMKKLGIKQTEIPAKYQMINLPFKEHYPVAWYSIIISIITILVTLFSWLTYLYIHEMNMRRQTFYALEEERESLALAIESGNTFAWRFQNDCLQFKNSFWKSINMKNVPLSVEKFTNFIHPDYRETFKHHWQEIFIQGTHAIELLCDFTGDGYQWWELRSSTMESVSGQQRTTGLILNINEHKKREQELIEARELAENAELKQSFLANMSHEIRTPLNAIVGFSNILASDSEIQEEERTTYINTINTNSELLLKLINDILEISRIESGYMSFEYQNYSVNTLIDEVYNTHRVILPSHLQFLKETAEEDLEIYVDKNRLTQVLTNFLNNASKFTPCGYIKLGYHYLPKEQQVHIFVEDSGKGIPQAEQKMIFSRFYKQDEFAQGTGLGLSICQVIIEKLGGHIHLWSEPGKGSRFTIILNCEDPLKRKQ